METIGNTKMVEYLIEIKLNRPSLNGRIESVESNTLLVAIYCSVLKTINKRNS